MIDDYFFSVPGRPEAEQLVEAFARMGFAEIGAKPYGSGWLVQVLDSAPYTAEGERSAVAREARRVALQHRGYLSTSSQNPQHLARLAPGMVISRVQPGSHPPIPRVRPTVTPPSASLALHEPTVAPAEPDLTGLDEVDWDGLEDAYGPATAIPEVLRTMAEFDDVFGDAAAELTGDRLLHQGSCYSATAEAIPYLVELAACGRGTPQQRLRLYIDLLYATSRYAEDLVDGAEEAAAEGVEPEPQEYSPQVAAAVGEHLPRLFARWSAEPPAIQIVLAGLAAFHPAHGSAVRTRIEALRDTVPGTREAFLLTLALAMLDGDEARMLTLVEEYATWEEALDYGYALDALNVAPPVRAGFLMAQGIGGF